MYAAHAVLRILHLLFYDIFMYTGLCYVEFWKDMGQYMCSDTDPPIQWVPGNLSLGVKRPGSVADYSPPSSAEVKNAWSYSSTPQYVFMAWCLVKHSGTYYNINTNCERSERDKSVFFLLCWKYKCKNCCIMEDLG
jgi:hypothetical protein